MRLGPFDGCLTGGSLEEALGRANDKILIFSHLSLQYRNLASFCRFFSRHPMISQFLL